MFSNFYCFGITCAPTISSTWYDFPTYKFIARIVVFVEHEYNLLFIRKLRDKTMNRRLCGARNRCLHDTRSYCAYIFQWWPKSNRWRESFCLMKLLRAKGIKNTQQRRNAHNRQTFFQLIGNINYKIKQTTRTTTSTNNRCRRLRFRVESGRSTRRLSSPQRLGYGGMNIK